MKHSPTSAQFFEAMYLEHEDPWCFASSQYELNRYTAILGTLGERRYRRAFEPGCSIGVLTSQLALRCDQVEAMDISPTAVEKARARCARHPNVSIFCESLPNAIPGGEFDLVVFSEIGYYFTGAELKNLAMALVEKTSIGGIFLAAHWLGSSPDHLQSGDHIHDILKKLPGLHLELSERHPDFRLDRWVVA